MTTGTERTLPDDRVAIEQNGVITMVSTIENLVKAVRILTETVNVLNQRVTQLELTGDE